MEPKAMGAFIRTLRKEKGLTQEQMAEDFYVSGKTVSRWETGAILPDLMTLQSIADYFQVSLQELIDGRRIRKGVQIMEETIRGEIKEEKPDAQPIEERPEEEESTAPQEPERATLPIDQETLQRITEYSEKKEKRSSRKFWLLIGLLLILGGAVAAFFWMGGRARELDRVQSKSFFGEVTHYYPPEGGGTEICLLCDGTSLVHVKITPETNMLEYVRELLNKKQERILLSVIAEYTMRQEQKARKEERDVVYTAVVVSLQGQNVPQNNETGDTPTREYPPGYDSPTAHLPVNELMFNYAAEQAELDGCVVMDGGSIQHGELRWERFLQQVNENQPAKIRVYFRYWYLSSAQYMIWELEYTGDGFVLRMPSQVNSGASWTLYEHHFRYLVDETTRYYETATQVFLLTDSPDITYEGYLEYSSKNGDDRPEAYDNVLEFLSRDISSHPELERGFIAVEAYDMDGDGGYEWIYLAPGPTSGLFTFSISVYGKESGRLYQRYFTSEFMTMKLVRTEDGICLHGVTQKNEEHTYRILVRGGILELEENGVTLKGWGE